MKNFLPTFLFAIISIGLMAQTPFKLQKQDPDFGREKHLKPLPLLENAPVYGEVNPYVSTFRNSELMIGVTRYDVQSNGSMSQRIYMHPDNTIGATWTYAMMDPGYADRGTAYNYFDGSSWGPVPNQRVETVRTGWANYAPYGPNGEVILSHMAAAAEWYLVLAKRENKGTGTWEESTLHAPAGAAGMLWAKMVTSGENHSTIHVLAITTPVANGGTLYEGQDGAIVYSRSSDGGQTWDIENVVLEGMGSSIYPGFSADSYAWAAPKGDVLAFSVSDGHIDSFVMKSEDGGDTWTKMVFYESIDNFLNADLPIGDVGGTDGSHAITIDNNGMVHVAVGRMVHSIPGDGSFYYYPYSNGLLYWNESMPPMDTTKVGSAILDIEGAVSPAYLLAEVFDNGEEMLELMIPNYYRSLTSMPALLYYDQQQVLVCFYSAITLGYDNGEHNYRHIWMRVSADFGQTWLEYYDLNDNFLNMFNENVYPSVSPTFTEFIHLLYQSDNFPGESIHGQNHAAVDNNMIYLKYGVQPGIMEKPAHLLGVEQLYPNPATDKATIIVNVDMPLTVKLSMVNLLGQQVHSGTHVLGYVGAHPIEWNVRGMNPGLYLVRVEAGNDMVTRKLIVH